MVGEGLTVTPALLIMHEITPVDNTRAVYSMLGMLQLGPVSPPGLNTPPKATSQVSKWRESSRGRLRLPPSRVRVESSHPGEVAARETLGQSHSLVSRSPWAFEAMT